MWYVFAEAQNAQLTNTQTIFIIYFFACGVFKLKYVVYMMSVLDSKMK